MEELWHQSRHFLFDFTSDHDFQVDCITSWSLTGNPGQIVILKRWSWAEMCENCCPIALQGQICCKIMLYNFWSVISTVELLLFLIRPPQIYLPRVLGPSSLSSKVSFEHLFFTSKTSTLETTSLVQKEVWTHTYLKWTVTNFLTWFSWSTNLKIADFIKTLHWWLGMKMGLLL